MRISDAIELGSTVMKAVPDVQSDMNMESGCALGMAAKAQGGGVVVIDGLPDRTGGNYWDIQWPWVMMLVRRPCWCWPLKQKMLVKDVIAHLFDQHVFRKGNWTLNELIAWVRSVEPAEPEPAAPATQDVSVEVSHG